MKRNILTLVPLILSCIFLQACMTYNDNPTSSWNGNSEAGTPVKTRLTGSDEGFRFLFIGSSPSQRIAVDNLYKAAEKAGYKIDGANYAFQNITMELSGFLYPLIGYGELIVSADLYKYDYKGTEYSIKENNSSIKNTENSISLFQNLF